MSRILCKQCQRPTIACICDFTCKINNKIPVLVLQHPSEVKQAKGTVALLSRSLSHCQVFVGEDFSQHTELNNLIANHQALLLYPSTEAQILPLTKNTLNSISLDDDEKRQQPKLLILLDGTWKKAYRMFMLSSNLQALAQVCLPEKLANGGQYLIRKVAKKNALSSLEACCFALGLLEGEINKNKPVNNELSTEILNNTQQGINCGIYQDLLNKFTQFNQFQLSFRAPK
jgi:DTW domain-containing protein YfiP